MQTRIIISGGGTGGHIFPAISIAQELSNRIPGIEILFVGAKGGMEMQMVPKHGFTIKEVWISGIHRQLTFRNILKNLSFPLKLVYSLIQARTILRSHKPQLVVGVGGFASGPIGRAATQLGIPLVICEQNAFPGLVNRWLAPRATKILLGNADAMKYFDQSKVVVTGNPIRSFKRLSKSEGADNLNLSPENKIVLSLGGSLGAYIINQAIKTKLDKIREEKIQLLWQCGKRYYETLKEEVQEDEWVHLKPFIEDMESAYAAADLIISRAGGSTISELIALSKPAILIPSPNVAEDHQTKNALSLADKDAAVLVKDDEAEVTLIDTAVALLKDNEKLENLTVNIRNIPKHESAKEIVDELLKIIYREN